MIWIASPGLQVSYLIYPVRDRASTKSSSWEPGFLKSWGCHSSVWSPRTVLARLARCVSCTRTCTRTQIPSEMTPALRMWEAAWATVTFHQQGFIHFSNIYWDLTEPATIQMQALSIHTKYTVKRDHEKTGSSQHPTCGGEQAKNRICKMPLGTSGPSCFPGA